MFNTKVDLSNNRGVIKSQNSILQLPGKTIFGNEREELETGPDLDTVQTLVPKIDNITSSFTAVTSTNDYTYSWGFDDMSNAESELTHFTLDNDPGDTYYVGPIWFGTDSVELNGETIFTKYEAVEFDMTLSEINDNGDGTISGSFVSTYEKIVADAIDYNGDFIWVEVKGTTETDSLIIKNIGLGPSTVDLGADNEGNVVTVASDKRLKENIKPIQSALEKVLGLNGVTYQWKDRKAGGDQLRIGFIAQQVKEIVPELVYNTGKGDYLGVHYSNAIPLLVEAIKELANGYENKGLVETKTITKEYNVEIIYSEDNKIILNHKGDEESAIGGGIEIETGNTNMNPKIILNEFNQWEFSPGFKIPYYTPNNSNDEIGGLGSITHDNNYLYVKTQRGWKRTRFENF